MWGLQWRRQSKPSTVEVPEEAPQPGRLERLLDNHREIGPARSAARSANELTNIANGIARFQREAKQDSKRTLIAVWIAAVAAAISAGVALLQLIREN